MKTSPHPRPFNSSYSQALGFGCRILCLTLALIAVGNASAQLVLIGTNYTQNFDGIASGLPTGWTVRTGANATGLGTAATFTGATKDWNNTGGNYGNCASVTGYGTNFNGTESSTVQAGGTNRCPGIRQTGSFGDPGAAFVLQITNTLGITNLSFSIDLNLLRTNGYSTTWTIDYAVSNAPAAFTTLGTYTVASSFSSTTANFALGLDANDQAQNVWVRVVALTAATGSGSRTTFGIDNFSLTYSNVTSLVPPTAPSISSQPAPNTTNAVGTSASFSVDVSGTPPLYYQWYKNGALLSNSGNVAGATTATLMVSPAFHTNAGDYTVVITNAAAPPNSVTSTIAKLTVVGFAIAPLVQTNTIAGTPLTVGLSFIDNQTSVTTASGFSSNQTILPNANISGAAAGSSGSVTMTPVTGTDGVVFIYVTASDGTFSTNASFPLMVVPSSEVIFNDHFDYANGPVTTNSLGLWRNHSGPAGEMIVTNGELRVSRSLTEDVNALLIGQPYLTNGPAILYSRFNVRFTTLPTTVGNFFAHFKDNTNTGLVGRVWTSLTNTPSDYYRLGIGNANGTTATTARVGQDLALNDTYTVVTRLVVSNGVSTIWVNPSAEADASATDSTPPPVPVDIVSYAFRQDGSEGIMWVDDLVVGTSFTAVLGTPSPVPLSITQEGADGVLRWAGSAFKLQAAPTVTSTFTNIPGATSPYTNPITGLQKYFRLKYP